MRTCRHFVIHKETFKIVFAHWSISKCQAFLDSLEDKEQYGLGYKWFSI